MTILTLIIPIYNVEEYIEECLNSVVRSMKNISGIEIILVDDGSKDRSSEIAQRYAQRYSNFSYYVKKNGGLSDARNFGLEKVNSDYVAFLDSDDY
ncbi:family 2 glycosyl transferase, partial [Planococcus glaciei]|uniref:glycosyltransferase family 2 protein n=1 Tax=Planococcus glaciei TaxID=459472 RepID=UPI0006BF4E34